MVVNMTDTPFKILAVDNAPYEGRILQLFFRNNSDYSLDFTNTAQEALEKVNISTYDLILANTSMPEMSGLELFNKLRSNNLNTPVIAYTADAFPESLDKTVRPYVQGILVKPVSREQLFFKIEEILIGTN
jgi:CheY-like chemotaxis protein